MKNGITLQELAAKLKDDAARQRDILADTRSIEVIGGSNSILLGIENEHYSVSANAHAQIAERTGIPKRYYDRMLNSDEGSRGLLAANIGHWFGHSPERRMVRTYGPTEGNDGPRTARAFLSDTYRRLDNVEVMNAAIPALAEASQNWRVESCQVTDDRLYLKAIFPQITGEIRKVGDIASLGIVISNSEVGKGAVTAYPLIYEYSCANGASFPRDGHRKAHLGRRYEDGLEGILTDEAMIADDQAYWLAFRDMVKHIASPEMFEQLIEECRNAQGRSILGSPIEAVKVLAKQESLTDVEQESVLDSLIRGGNFTQWGLSQAVTHSCQTVESYDRASELENLGGKIVRLEGNDLRDILEAGRGAKAA